MGLITKEVEIEISNYNHKRYDKIPHVKISDNKIKIKIEDLSKGSSRKVKVKCDICGKEYPLSYYAYVKHNHNGLIYCNNCANAVLHSGKNNHKWNPNKTDEERVIERGYKGYKKFIKRIMNRDDFTCQCCGAKSEKGKHLILQVHHLNGYSWCEKDRLNDTNAITLCENCHKKFHSIYGYGDNTKEQFEEWIGKPIELLKSEYVEPKDCEIYCVEENKIYTIDEFCKEKGANRNWVKCICNPHNKNKGIKGVHILYLKDYKKMTDEEINNLLKNKHKREVICLETNIIYDSLIDASRKTNISRGFLFKVCNKQSQTVYNQHWLYLDDYKKMSEQEIQEILNSCQNYNRKKIICVEDKKIINSLVEGEKYFNVDKSTIRRHCFDKKPIKGKHVLFLEDYEKMSEQEIQEICSNMINSCKKIICLDTKECFDSINDASKKYNISYSLILNCCIGVSKSAKKLHWKYLNDYEKLTEDEIAKICQGYSYKKVVCLENEECFDSIAEAERKYNVRHIWECCNKRTKKVGGYHWVYFEDFKKMSKEEIKKLIS